MGAHDPNSLSSHSIHFHVLHTEANDMPTGNGSEFIAKRTNNLGKKWLMIGEIMVLVIHVKLNTLPTRSSVTRFWNDFLSQFFEKMSFSIQNCSAFVYHLFIYLKNRFDVYFQESTAYLNLQIFFRGARKNGSKTCTHEHSTNRSFTKTIWATSGLTPQDDKTPDFSIALGYINVAWRKILLN